MQAIKAGCVPSKALDTVEDITEASIIIAVVIGCEHEGALTQFQWQRNNLQLLH